MVSIEDLVCQVCIGCSLSLCNNGTKLCIKTDIFVTSLRANYSQPEIYAIIAATDSKCKCSVNSFSLH